MKNAHLVVAIIALTVSFGALPSAVACQPFDCAFGQGFRLPADDATPYPANAAVVLGGYCIAEAQLAATVDGQPVELVEVHHLPKTMISLAAQSSDYTENESWRAWRLEPEPPVGSEVHITGFGCDPEAIDFRVEEPLGDACRVELRYRVGPADPDPPRGFTEAWYDLLRHPYWETCECGRDAAPRGSTRYQLRVDGEVAPSEFLRVELVDADGQVLAGRWFDQIHQSIRVPGWHVAELWTDGYDPSHVVQLRVVDAAGNRSEVLQVERPCRAHDLEALEPMDDFADECFSAPSAPDWDRLERVRDAVCGAGVAQPAPEEQPPPAEEPAPAEEPTPEEQPVASRTTGCSAVSGPMHTELGFLLLVIGALRRRRRGGSGPERRPERALRLPAPDSGPVGP